MRVHKTAAMTDPLTGLFNRRGFIEAPHQLMRAPGASAIEPVSVLMFDLDHFKSINDRFGHAVGDEALQLVRRDRAREHARRRRLAALRRRGVRRHPARRSGRARWSPSACARPSRPPASRSPARHRRDGQHRRGASAEPVRSRRAARARRRGALPRQARRAQPRPCGRQRTANEISQLIAAARHAKAERPVRWSRARTPLRAFSSEVGAGSREENTIKTKT